jgi:hypothetical protein
MFDSTDVWPVGLSGSLKKWFFALWTAEGRQKEKRLAALPSDVETFLWQQSYV